MGRIEKEIGELLGERELTLGIVESATGGLLSHLITDVPGSSKYYQGSVTAYSNRAKICLLGVKEETIIRYGAVSPQVAEEMAAGGRQALCVDICLSDTGVAGPGGGTPEKPVGLVYVGLSDGKRILSRKFYFEGSRQQNKRQAAEAALSWLKEYLTTAGDNLGS